jgi:hypothetical protein
MNCPWRAALQLHEAPWPRAGLIEVASDERGAVQDPSILPDVDKVDAHTGEDWNVWCRETGNRPANIPASPAGTYKNKGWIDWPDFLQQPE